MPSLSAYRRWLQPPAKVALIFLAAVAPLLLTLYWSAPGAAGRCFQIGGLFLQLIGFITVWQQIHGTLRDHQQPTWRARIAKWWASRPGQHHLVGAIGIASSGALGVGRAKVRQNPKSSSVEDRIAALEENLARVDTYVDQIAEASEKRDAELKIALEAQGKASAAAVEDLRKRLRDQAVGSADLQFVGLLWFIAGCIYSSIPTDLSRLPWIH
jgi:hypothetical protein